MVKNHYGLLVKPDKHLESVETNIGKMVLYDPFDVHNNYAQTGTVISVGDNHPFGRFRKGVKHESEKILMSNSPEYDNDYNIVVGDTVMWKYQAQIDKNEGDTILLRYDLLVAKWDGELKPFNGYLFVEETSENEGIVKAMDNPNRGYKFSNLKDKTPVAIGDTVGFTRSVKTFSSLSGIDWVRIQRKDIVYVK